MKAIDRAAYWAEMLEQAGFDIECETDMNVIGHETLSVFAKRGNSKVVFVIRMDSKFTRYVTGSTGTRYMWGAWTRKPSQMSRWVSREVEYAHYEMRQEVTA